MKSLALSHWSVRLFVRDTNPWPSVPGEAVLSPYSLEVGLPRGCLDWLQDAVRLQE